MLSISDVLLDPHGFKPWQFPDPETVYSGIIVTAPAVCYRLNENGVPQRTPEGVHRWALWLSVKTDDDYRGFCIDRNPIARAFNGNATERNLRRLAERWRVSGVLQLSWTRDGGGKRVYRGRYMAPGQTDMM